MTKPISIRKLTDTLSISEYPATSGHCGFWLHDTTQGMNLAMCEPTVEAALLKAIIYYQRRFAETRGLHAELQAKVDSFLVQFRKEIEDEL
jgi:hypothetical protein